MPSRRRFVAGLLSASALPAASWADAGAPAFLSAGQKPDGSHVLCGLDAVGNILFQRPLPARGHAAAAHPYLAQAVTFARRPGRFAIVVDCVTGREVARLDAPAGRHFYGHGVFSDDGEILFTTESDYEQATGRIGVWDAVHGYRRVTEYASGGVGPHDIKLMPDSTTLVVANGGIETHPDTGRAKLNLPRMRANLSYLGLDGHLEHKVELNPAQQRNSIRHLAVSKDGAVAFAMQWQGDLSSDTPLLGVHNRQTRSLRFAETPTVRSMQGYLGSIAIRDDGAVIAVTSPRSGIASLISLPDLHHHADIPLEDVCGVVPAASDFLLTTGTGRLHHANGDSTQHAIRWDNHIVAL